MRIRVIQHAPFEHEGYIGHWARESDAVLSRTALYDDEPLPHPDDCDAIIVMGGPMGVHDDDRYPWLLPEKRFIADCINRGIHVIGICLGAQLIASVLGAAVYKNRCPEIGWYPVRMQTEHNQHPALAGLPAEFVAFHWHGDTFDIPAGAVLAASSEACGNQLFMYGETVAGFQFHLESTAHSIDSLIAHCGREIGQGEFEQSAEVIRQGFGNIAPINNYLRLFLQSFLMQC